MLERKLEHTCKKISNGWKKLDRPVLVNQRELVLGIAVCALGSALLGMLLSPRRDVSICSGNGSNNSGNRAPEKEKEAEEEKKED